MYCKSIAYIPCAFIPCIEIIPIPSAMSHLRQRFSPNSIAPERCKNDRIRGIVMLAMLSYIYV